MSVLTIQLPGLPPVTHVLKDDTITIGRMKGNTIVIDDTSVSLCHAKISRTNGRFYLKDLNSTNGTLVNGQTISEAPLQNHDRVRFADVTAEFIVEGTSEPASAVQPAIQTPPAPAVQLARNPAAAAPVSAPAKPVAQAPAAPEPVVAKRRRFPLVPIAATAMALTIAAFFGWRFLHRAGSGTDNPQPVLAKTASAPAAGQLPASVPAAPASGDETKNLTIAEWITVLKADDVVVRRNAARALNSFGAEAKAAVPDLHNALQDPDPEVRIWSALALIDHKSYDKAIVPILVQALQQDDALLRQVSCLSLAVIPHEESDKETIVPALAEAAGRDANADVRSAAVSALKIIAPELVGREASR